MQNGASCRSRRALSLSNEIAIQTHIYLQKLASIQPRARRKRMAASAPGSAPVKGSQARRGICVLSTVKVTWSRVPFSEPFPRLVFGCVNVEFCEQNIHFKTISSSTLYIPEICFLRSNYVSTLALFSKNKTQICKTSRVK